MIEQSRLERLYEQKEGVYAATVLVQKRLRELNRGARRLVPQEGNTTLETVLMEIEAEKIELIEDNEANRTLLTRQTESIAKSEAVPVEVDESSTEQELERRLISVFNKDSE